MGTTNFYFGKLEFVQTGLLDFDPSTPDDSEERRKEKFYNYVKRSNVVFEDVGKETAWRFGQCEIENGNIIGRFGKIFTEEQTQWDDEEEDYIPEREEVEVADVSHFVIFPSIPGIAFNRKHRIGPNQFKDAFVGGYNQSDCSGKIDMEILRTGGEYSYKEFVSNVDKIREIKFELEPTNPYPDDDMEILDDHIRAMNAETFEMGAEADDDEELDPREDFLRSGGAMSDGDYGKFKATYIDDDGEEQEYDSRGKHVKKEGKEPETVGGLIPQMGQLLRNLKDAVDNGPPDQSENLDD